VTGEDEDPKGSTTDGRCTIGRERKRSLKRLGRAQIGSLLCQQRQESDVFDLWRVRECFRQDRRALGAVRDPADLSRPAREERLRPSGTLLGRRRGA
jgi:hypothetical protein